MPSYLRVATILTVLNLKGGVGKTHTTWLIASVAEEHGLRVLLVDLDTQANLTRSFLDDVDPHRTAAEFFNPAAEHDIASLIHRTSFKHLDLIPSSATLAPFDLSDQQAWEQNDLHLALREPIERVCNQYDFIVLDCPPRLSLVSFAALCAADHLIVPLEAADWGAQGVKLVADAAEYVRARFNERLTLLGYLVSKYKQLRSYQRTYLVGLRKHFGPLVFDTVVPDLAEFEKSVTDRLPVTLRAPKDPAAQIARRFFDEVCRRIARESQGRKRTGAHTRPKIRLAAGRR